MLNFIQYYCNSRAKLCPLAIFLSNSFIMPQFQPLTATYAFKIGSVLILDIKQLNYKKRLGKSHDIPSHPDTDLSTDYYIRRTILHDIGTQKSPFLFSIDHQSVSNSFLGHFRLSNSQSVPRNHP